MGFQILCLDMEVVLLVIVKHGMQKLDYVCSKCSHFNVKQVCQFLKQKAKNKTQDNFSKKAQQIMTKL